MKQFILPLANELIVDNFAGGGGASTGIEWATGRHVDIAINHDPEAIAMHMANHPQTRHYCESVWDINPREVCAGRPVGLAWFSPDCKHFSKAKGGKPVEKSIRGLAWVAVRWAATVKPRVIILENVEEFQTWGPLTSENLPDPARKGFTFRRWVREMEHEDYDVQWRELRACDHDVPTIRKRLFVVAVRKGVQIVWPAATNGAGLKPYRTAAECIDWSIPCPSIFERARPLAENTLRRIAAGIKRYVIDAAEPFIVGVGGRAGQSRPRSTDEPYQTVTAKADAALVTPTLISVSHGDSGGRREYPATNPLGTLETSNKYALVSAFMAKHYGGQFTGRKASDMREPLPTVTARGTQLNAVTSHLVKLHGTCRDGQPVTEPMPTIRAEGTHIGEVRAFLIKYYGNERDGFDPREPMHTVPTKDRIGLVTVHGEQYIIADIGMRMLTPRELFRAQGFPDSYIIDPIVNGKPLTKTAQVRMCGNSVCPPLAAAVVRANYSDQRAQEETA